MGQEPETPAEGQEPKAPESQEGQEPQEPPKGESKTFDEEYVKSLRAEAAASRKARQELEAKIAEFEDRDKSELEKLTGKLSKAEQAKADAEARLLRYEVAAEKQVPAEAMDLLVGTTREELEAKADRLLELVKTGEKNPEFDGGVRDPAPEPKTPDQAHDELVVALFGGKTT